MEELKRNLAHQRHIILTVITEDTDFFLSYVVCFKGVLRFPVLSCAETKNNNIVTEILGGRIENYENW